MNKLSHINEKYVAFLRGINVGGHHKVPMEILRKEFEQIGYSNVFTILNSGNVIFEAQRDKLENIEKNISEHLKNHFDFPIPVIVRKSEAIIQLINTNPFKGIKINKEIRLYVSFLKYEKQLNHKLPWISEHKSYKIIQQSNKNILSILNLSITGNPNEMEALERFFGKDITTRSWKTIKRIENKIKANHQ